ncbi:MAG TPA: hemerythrin domain-containing protein [Candidatus Binataceae bacterium]|nr:hemerythrin domain-containing protein [Candidatus Binataceae bacterium]
MPAHGQLYALMAAEHLQLDRLLARASERDPGGDAAYEHFRQRLLRHISLEEKILLPMAARKSGEALPLAKRLQLDHGALAALLMLPPSGGGLHAIRAVLAVHNPLEEMAEGVYQQCEELAGDELPDLLGRLSAAPAVPVSSWSDSSKVYAAARRVLARAGYDPQLLEASGETAS